MDLDIYLRACVNQRDGKCVITENSPHVHAFRSTYCTSRGRLCN